MYCLLQFRQRACLANDAVVCIAAADAAGNPASRIAAVNITVDTAGDAATDTVVDAAATDTVVDSATRIAAAIIAAGAGARTLNSLTEVPKTALQMKRNTIHIHVAT